MCQLALRKAVAKLVAGAASKSAALRYERNELSHTLPGKIGEFFHSVIAEDTTFTPPSVSF